jgi:hypothetical protein
LAAIAGGATCSAKQQAMTRIQGDQSAMEIVGLLMIFLVHGPDLRILAVAFPMRKLAQLNNPARTFASSAVKPGCAKLHCAAAKGIARDERKCPATP